MTTQQPCMENTEAIQNVAEDFSREFREAMEEHSQDVRRKADELNRRGRDIAEDGERLIDADVTWEDTELLLPVVEVTINEQEWILRLPQFKWDDTEIVLDIPEVTFRTKKIGQYPETIVKWEVDWVLGIKTKIPKTTIRWRDIKTKVPEFVMRERRIVLGLPQVWMDETRMVLGVPEFRTSQKRVVLKLPRFEMSHPDSIAGRADDITRDAKRLEADAAARPQELLRRLREDTKADLVGPVHAYVSCLREQLAGHRQRAVETHQHAANAIEEGLKAIAAQGGADSDAATEMRAQRRRLVAEMEKNLALLDEEIEKLNVLEKTVIDEILSDLMVQEAA